MYAGGYYERYRNGPVCFRPISLTGKVGEYKLLIDGLVGLMGRATNCRGYIDKFGAISRM